MSKDLFPPGDKIVSGKTSIVSMIDFDKYMKGSSPKYILQCNFYDSIKKETKTVDLFYPNNDFAKYEKNYDYVACSVQKI